MVGQSGPGWIFDDILDANPREVGQSRSPLEYLLASGAVGKVSLCRLADELQARGSGTVGVLFQLPFEVHLDTTWITLPTSPDSISAEVNLTLAALTMKESGDFEVIDPSESDRRGWGITQGIALFKVWGKRKQPHIRYLSTLDFHDRWNIVVVPQRESWIDNRPMTVRDYELNFARRLRIEVSTMLRTVLPALSLASRSEAPLTRWTYGFVPMLAPGKIAHTTTIPVARHLFDQPPSLRPALVSTERVRQALANPGREFSSFERQLFALERLRRDGEISLAVIGTAALIEWLLKTRTSDIRKGSRLVDLLARQREIGLPSELIDLADQVRSARNQFVHGAPPERSSMRDNDPAIQPGRALPGPVTSDAARQYIEVAFELFRHLNRSCSG